MYVLMKLCFCVNTKIFIRYHDHLFVPLHRTNYEAGQTGFELISSIHQKAPVMSRKLKTWLIVNSADNQSVAVSDLT